MRAAGVIALVLTAACLGSCAASMESEPALSAEQWREIQTREVEWPRDVTLRAAAAVLLDEGFLFTMSDFEAGLVAGARGPAVATGDAAAPILGSDVRFVQVWVQHAPGNPRRTQIRADFRNYMGRRADTERVTRFVTGLERRAMAAPAGGGT